MSMPNKRRGLVRPQAGVNSRLSCTSRPPRRFYPPGGSLLTLDNIRGPWRPSGAVEGCGMFAVVWTTPAGAWWAPLCDFTPADQLRLIELDRQLDLEQFGRR